MLGIASIVAVVFLEIFNSVACYKHGLEEAIAAFDLVAIPMIPALWLCSFQTHYAQSVPLLSLPHGCFWHFSLIACCHTEEEVLP